MSERAPLRLALVGCGRATARLHLPALRRVPSVDVVALADRHPERDAVDADAEGVMRFGEAARARVAARYTWEGVTAQYERLFAEVVGDRVLR